MPLVTIEPGLRFFYNIYSSTGSTIDESKPIILMLHPRFYDHEFFSPQYTDELLADQFNLVVPDHHHHGLTESELDDEPYDYDKVINDLFRFLDALNIDSCHLWGVSLGALLAVRMAILHPERIRSLLLCSMPSPVESPENIIQHRAVWEAILAGEDGTDGLPSNIIAVGQALFWGKKGRKEEDHLKWAATSKFVPSNRKLFKKVYSAILDRQSPSTSEWQKIKMPVLLVHAAGDLIYPPSVARINYDLLSEASNKEIIILDNDAHLFTWPEAERVNPMSVKFFQKYAATTA